MSSVHDPTDKKALAYARDHYSTGKYEKRYRKIWPKIKRRMARATRHIAADAVRQAVTTGDAVLAPRPKQKHKLRQRASASLRQVVSGTKSRRIKSAGVKKRRKMRQQESVAEINRKIAEQEALLAARPAAKNEKRPRRHRSTPATAPTERGKS